MKNYLTLLLILSFIPLFSQEIYPVKKYSRWVFIDSSGREVFSGYDFNKVTEFKNNKAAVYNEVEGWRYVTYEKYSDEDFGNFELGEERFIYANAFYDGHALVRKASGKWCFIDEKERCAISLKEEYGDYDKISKFKSGCYCVDNYVTKCYDKKNHIILDVPLTYERLPHDPYAGNFIDAHNVLLNPKFEKTDWEKIYRLTQDVRFIQTDHRVSPAGYKWQLKDLVTGEILLDSCWTIHFDHPEDSICFVRDNDRQFFYNYNQQRIIIENVELTVPEFVSANNGYNHTYGFGKKSLAAVLYRGKFVYINRKGKIVWQEN